MADVSMQLRRAREQAGLEIADISTRTKIKPAFLAAIERGEYERLPGNFFTRAFLKAYAAEVGLDSRDIAHQYDESCGRAEPLTLQELSVVLNQKHPPLPPLVDRMRYRWAKRMQGRDAIGARFPMPESHVPGLGPAIAAILLVVALIVVASVRTPDTPVVEAGAVGTTGIAEAAQPPAASVPDMLTIAIKPAAQIWVTAKADGEPALFRMLQPGEAVTLTAHRELSFRIGNAVAFEYTINGLPGKPIGGADEVREFVITPDNYRTFAR